MKKCFMVMTLMILLFILAIPVSANAMSAGTGDDITDLVNSLDTYFNDYLPSVNTDAKEAIKSYVKEGLTTNKDKFFMPMMSTLANIRKAGQSGESENVSDVIKDYNKLSDKAKENTVNYLTSAFTGVYLQVEFSKGLMTVFNGEIVLANIEFNVNSTVTGSDNGSSTEDAGNSNISDTKQTEGASSSTKKNDNTKDSSKETGNSKDNSEKGTSNKSTSDKSTPEKNTVTPGVITPTVAVVSEAAGTSGSTASGALAAPETTITPENSTTTESSVTSQDTTSPEESNTEYSEGESTSQGSGPSQAMIDAANSGEPAPDVTTTYFTAYIPGVPAEYIEKTKEMIKIYSDNGGGPAGSGALWRCIREIGQFMGREVEMAPDYSSFTVTEEGVTDFMELSEEVKEKVVEKVIEGMTGIAVTASYENGTFTFTKLGEVQFTYTVNNAPDITETETATVVEDAADMETVNTDQTKAAAKENASKGVVLSLVIVVAIVALTSVGYVVYRKKYKK